MLLVGDKTTSSCKFVRLSAGVFVRLVQLDKSVLCCKAKFVEGIIQESLKLVFAGTMFSCGVGVDCEIQIPPPTVIDWPGLFVLGSPAVAATNLCPSAEEATQVQNCTGTQLDVQVAPEFVEV